jgi:hypothetical protein
LFEQQIAAVRQDAGLSSMQRAAAVQMLRQRQLAEAMRARERVLSEEQSRLKAERRNRPRGRGKGTRTPRPS